jgi:hypothetical protein
VKLDVNRASNASRNSDSLSVPMLLYRIIFDKKLAAFDISVLMILAVKIQYDTIEERLDLLVVSSLSAIAWILSQFSSSFNLVIMKSEFSF